MRMVVRIKVVPTSGESRFQEAMDFSNFLTTRTKKSPFPHHLGGTIRFFKRNFRFVWRFEKSGPHPL